MSTTVNANPVRAGVIGLIMIIAGVLSAQNYDRVPYLSAEREYGAFFAEAAGLAAGSPVEIAGVQVGKVSGVELDGPQVLVRFTVHGAEVGDRTEAAIRTRTVLGGKMLELRPRGTTPIRPDDIIPVERTSTPYVLPDTLGELTTAISGLDTDDLTGALQVLSSSIDAAEPQLAAALDGVARLSDSVAGRDQMVRDLLTHASGVTGVLATRSNQINLLVNDGAALFAALEARRSALETLLTNLTAVSAQLRTVIAENRDQLGPVLERFGNVLDLLERRKADIEKSLLPLSQYALSLGESVASGPFFKAYIANLLPGQFLQPFIDAAFQGTGVGPAGPPAPAGAPPAPGPATAPSPLGPIALPPLPTLPGGR